MENSFKKRSIAQIEEKFDPYVDFICLEALTTGRGAIQNLRSLKSPES
jgi:hypothetical protein